MCKSGKVVCAWYKSQVICLWNTNTCEALPMIDPRAPSLHLDAVDGCEYQFKLTNDGSHLVLVRDNPRVLRDAKDTTSNTSCVLVDTNNGLYQFDWSLIHHCHNDLYHFNQYICIFNQSMILHYCNGLYHLINLWYFTIAMVCITLINLWYFTVAMVCITLINLWYFTVTIFCTTLINQSDTYITVTIVGTVLGLNKTFHGLSLYR